MIKKKIMIIEKDCDNWKSCDDWKRLSWLKKIVITEKIVMIEKNCDNWKRLKKKLVLVIRWIFSSDINEGIQTVLFFKRKDLTCTKSTKRTKRKQATLTQTF